MKGKKKIDICILIVDDESRMRKLIKDFLTAKGYKILEAEDGEKALQVFEENSEKIELAYDTKTVYVKE